MIDTLNVIYIVGVAVAVSAGLVLLVQLFVTLQAKLTRSGSRCAWSKDRIQPHQGMARWICRTCGETGFSTDRRAPKTCAKPKRVRPI